MRRPLLVLLLTLFAAAGCNRKAPGISADYPVTKLTERVYVIHGPNETPNKKNQGFFNNPGFVLTKKGVVVIDPGSSVQSSENDARHGPRRRIGCLYIRLLGWTGRDRDGLIKRPGNILEKISGGNQFPN